jgi:putative restriction endonuclease
MRYFVGVTDYDWYGFLSARPGIDEVNFWQPSGGREFKALQPGDLFLFKLHSPRNFIVGGGVFAHWSSLPVSLAWEAFGEKNGVASLEQMRTRLAKYRHEVEDPRVDHLVGCILLEQPFFLRGSEWIPAPEDWKPNIVQGKGYDSAKEEGHRVWQQLTAIMASTHVGEVSEWPHEPAEMSERYGKPMIVTPRLGQGSFRVVVTDAYDRRCAVTGERTLPVLQAAHIKPYGLNGPHSPQNGLLLRSDLHTLLDCGYVTVTPDLRVKVSRRIREEYENGRDYYALDGQPVRLPSRADLAPSREYLEWHASNVFRG